MRLFLSETFFDAVFKLPKKTQDKVVTFQKKFRENPASPGIHLEPIAQFKNSTMRTARVDDNYRVVIGVLDGNTYSLKKGVLKDNVRFNAGAEILPRIMSRNFFERIRYRFGVGYSTPYYYINGQEGPKDFSASIGFGIPIMNGYNSRSVLNISAQWARTSAKDLITENTFRINVGLTFNERWFAKWKVE